MPRNPNSLFGGTVMRQVSFSCFLHVKENIFVPTVEPMAKLLKTGVYELFMHPKIYTASRSNNSTVMKSQVGVDCERISFVSLQYVIHSISMKALKSSKLWRLQEMEIVYFQRSQPFHTNQWKKSAENPLK